MNKNNIAQRIKSLRKEFNITQRDLADRTGISLSSIISYENQQREPSAKSLVALEQFFNVSGEYLRGETESRVPKKSLDELIQIAKDKAYDIDEIKKYYQFDPTIHLTAEEIAEKRISQDMKDIIHAVKDLSPGIQRQMNDFFNQLNRLLKNANQQELSQIILILTKEMYMYYSLINKNKKSQD